VGLGGRGGFVANASASALDARLWGRYLHAAYRQGVTSAFSQAHRRQQAQVTDNETALVFHGAREHFVANALRTTQRPSLQVCLQRLPPPGRRRPGVPAKLPACLPLRGRVEPPAAYAESPRPV
jgi:hypothetical protein